MTNDQTMKTFTAWCQDVSGTGTIWIGHVETEQDVSQEKLILTARADCAFDWFGDASEIESIHCLGLARGHVDIIHWDDIND